jgi:hypothetical protein
MNTGIASTTVQNSSFQLDPLADDLHFRFMLRLLLIAALLHPSASDFGYRA